MQLSEFIAEIKTSMKSYDSANLIDDISIQNWVIDELRRFGANIMELQDTIVSIKNSQGRLPNNYWHPRVIAKVEPYYCENLDGDIEDVRYSRALYDKIERSATWNTAGECESITEKKVTERIYIDRERVDLHYSSPMMLNVIKGVIQKKGEMACLNLKNTVKANCPYNVVVNNRTIQTNFKEGNVYVQYYGLLADEDGEIIIPETQHNRVKTYLEYYVKKRIIEDLIINNDDPNVARMLQYYSQESQNQFSLALTETKFESLNWQETKKKLRDQSKRKMLKFEQLFPRH